MNHTQSRDETITFGQRAWTVGLISVVLLLALTHILQTPGSLWWDELYTIVNYVRPGALHAWVADYYANNHTLFSMVSALSATLLGPGEVAYRLPSLAAGLTAYTILIVQVRRYVGRIEALTVGCILLASPLLLYWIPQARGYGFATLASVGLVSGSLTLVRGRNTRARTAWAQILAGGLVGIATLPQFAVPFTLTCLCLALIDRHRWRVIAARWAAVGVAAFLFYLPSNPLLLLKARNGDFGPRLGVIDALTGPFRFQIVGTLKGAGDLSELVGDRLVPVVVAVLVLAALLAFVRAYLEKEWSLVILTSLPVFGTYVTFVLLRSAVTDRTLLFLVPQISLLLAFGFGLWAGDRSRTRALTWLRRAPLIALLPVLVLLVLKMAFSWSATPIENYRGAAAIAGDSTAGTAITDSTRALGFSYYLPGIIPLDEQGVVEAICDGSGSVAYIAHDYKRPFEPPLQCLEDRSAVRVDVSQRRRGTMSVWLVPERTQPGDE